MKLGDLWIFSFPNFKQMKKKFADDIGDTKAPKIQQIQCGHTRHSSSSLVSCTLVNPTGERTFTGFLLHNLHLLGEIKIHKSWRQRDKPQGNSNGTKPLGSIPHWLSQTQIPLMYKKNIEVTATNVNKEKNALLLKQGGILGSMRKVRILFCPLSFGEIPLCVTCEPWACRVHTQSTDL